MNRSADETLRVRVLAEKEAWAWAAMRLARGARIEAVPDKGQALPVTGKYTLRHAIKKAAGNLVYLCADFPGLRAEAAIIAGQRVRKAASAGLRVQFLKG